MEDVKEEPKKRKELSPEALEKLKLAREKANAKRKELAEQRAAEREELVQQKLEEAQKSKQDRLEKQADIEAKKRVQHKPKKDTVVVEYSSSDSDDFDFQDARVMFVRKDRAKPPKQPTEQPSVEVPPAPDPLEGAYQHMFGPRF